MSDGPWSPSLPPVLGGAMRFLAAIVESSDAAIIGKDLNGVVRSWNPGAERLYGYTAHEIVGSPVNRLVPTGFPDDVPELLERLGSGQAIRDHETLRARKDGRIVDVSLILSPVRDEAGTIVGASTIARDITERKLGRTFDRLLARLGRELGPSLIAEEILGTLTSAAVDSIADYCVAYRAGTEGLRRVSIAHTDAVPADLVARLEGLGPVVAEGDPMHAVLLGDEPVREGRNGRLRAPVPVPDNAESSEILSTTVVPLEARGVRHAVLVAGTVRGGKRPLDAASRPKLREVGQRVGMALDNARLQQRLRTSEARLRLTLEAAQMGTWDWDLRTGAVRWDETLERAHGLEPGAFPSTFEAFRADIHPGDRDRLEEEIRRLLDEDRAEYAIEYRILRPDGEERWLSAKGSVLRDGAGAPIRMVGVCTDVTRRKRREGIERFLAEASHAFIAPAEPREVLERIAGMAVPDVADWCAIDLRHGNEVERAVVAHSDPELQELVKAFYRRHPPRLDTEIGSGAVLRTGESQFIRELTPDHFRAAGYMEAEASEILRKAGPRSALYAPIETGTERVGTLVLAHGDSGRRFEEEDIPLAEGIADRVAAAIQNARLHQELRKAVQGLEGAVRTRDEVLAYVSHDLKNYLGAIDGGARTLAELSLEPPKREEILRRMLSTSGRAIRMIEDLLDVARKDAGHFTLEIEALRPADLVRSASEPFVDGARLEEIDLGVEVEEGLPPVRADTVRIHRVFSNLLTNAIRHAGRGGSVRLGARAERPGVVTFRVEDDGPGFPPEVRERAFDRYWKGEGSGGMGLGLPIARMIVEAHGGTIRIDSEPDGGTVVEFELPVAAPEGRKR